MTASGFTEKIITRVESGAAEAKTDELGREEPLEIRLGFRENGKFTLRSISITMRTPGADFELAAGFLFTESIIKLPSEITAIKFCGRGADGAQNTVRVDLAAETSVDLNKLERHFYTTSSCGVCGKTSLAALETGVCRIAENDFGQIPAAVIHRLPSMLRESQTVFERTGGLHAAAIFDKTGKLELLREDVGRHNAVDKLIGAYFLEAKMPLAGEMWLVSGRASFELVQKALMAQIPILAAVGAPSSLAVELAEKFGMTLIGFVRGENFNIYTHPHRILVGETIKNAA